MLLADDIARKAIEWRNQGADLQALQEVVEFWAGDLFWNRDAEYQAATLEQAMATDPALSSEVAEALQFSQPRDDSAELTLLAVDAARGRAPQPGPGIFAGELDWYAWRKQPDLRQLQDLLSNNAPVRNAFARAVGAYPGKRYAKQIAMSAVAELRGLGPRATAVRAVLERRLLRWESFQAAQQDEIFGRALAERYEFREQVARAIQYEGSEAKRLAAFAVNLWRAVPLKCWHKPIRKHLLQKLSGSEERAELHKILRTSADHEPDENGWRNLESQLASHFGRNPMLSCVLWETLEWPQPFALVLREELRQIEARRKLNLVPGEVADLDRATDALDISDLAAQKNLFGVAFSGGGIRSATFNLGVIQKLSDLGLLGRVDYLSTVSGGGYIGAWLGAWNQRTSNQPIQTFVSQQKDLLSPKCSDPRADAQKPIRFLREFSNYLTPTLGSFSFDTWTMAAVYTRNVVLNQAILIAVLGSLLLIPRLLIFPMRIAMEHDRWMWLAAGLALLLAVIFIALNMRNAVAGALGHRVKLGQWLDSHLPDWVYEAAWIQVLVIGAMLTAVYCGSVWLWRNLTYVDKRIHTLSIIAFICAAVLSLLLSGLGGFVEKFRGRQSGNTWFLLFLVLVMITVLSAGASLALLRLYIVALRALSGSPQGAWHAEVFGPVMLLAVLVVPGTLQVGLMGVDFPDAGREWLSRFRAVCSVYTTYWIALMGAAIYGPLLILSLARWSQAAFKVWISGLTIGWVFTTISGLAAGNSKRTGIDREGNPSFSWMQVLAKVGPPVFIVGLLLWITTLEELLLAHGKIHPYTLCTLVQHHWQLLEPWPLWSRSGWLLAKTGWLFLALALAGIVLAWRVDINEFSMHHFYKNRLVRCYLGASSANRKPNPFTGFDGKDDFPISQMRAIAAAQQVPYRGPYPIVNATLNLSVGKQLAWQERKGASFIFTPCFCGFDVQGWANATGSKAGRTQPDEPKCTFREKLRCHGYRKTDKYSQKGGPLFGTSMAISGAAANPNQGYNTSPAVSFLMTMFDVRLGWWLGNPRRDSTSKLSSPRFGLAALISELLGSTDDETRFVSLSDGGHFDNMGLYELVRRRCSFILLSDAEQDGDYKFEGLGSAIRKCRVDFGALIEIDPVRVKPEDEGNFSESHCAVGKIRYLDGSIGTIIYLKASMTGDEPEDVTQYRAAQAQFPHETTADQWFGESQFESYRALGYHATHHSLEPAKRWLTWNSEHPDVPKFFEATMEYWYPMNPSLKDTASKHTTTLAELLDRIRQNTNLHALGAELFPGGMVPAGTVRAATEEFYLSMCIIQLMEDLFFDFRLDHKVWFDDPRIGGWRYLFRRWKGVPTVAAAWSAERDTFRKDFQLFWMSL
jgi:hypothetical protein